MDSFNKYSKELLYTYYPQHKHSLDGFFTHSLIVCNILKLNKKFGLSTEKANTNNSNNNVNIYMFNI